MFGSNKKDPLVDAVAKVMQENQVRREVERQFNEDLGIHSKKALPFEKHAEYDRVLAEKTQQALSEGYSMKKEALHPNQQKLDVHEPEKDKLTAKDFEMLRARKKNIEESGDMGPAKVKKEKTTTYRHKTSGKEVVGVKPPPGDDWEVVKEELDPEKKALPPGKSSDPDFAAPGANPDSEPRIKFEPEKKEPPVPLPPKRPASLKEAKYSAKAARAGEDIGKPGKNFEMIAKKAGERYGSEERGKKVAGAVLAKIRAKHMKEETIEEKAPEGAKFERMVKHIKDKYSKDGKLTDKEKSIAYATAWKAKNKEEK
jgi:hypothetical protein